MSTKGTAQTSMRGYDERLGALLQQCAEDFQPRPDAFLWNCRRCLECIAYSYLSLQKTGFQPGTNEGELSNFPKNLPKNLQAEWRFVLEKSNLAVHVQAPQPGEHKEDSKTCCGHLDKIVRWFFEQSNAGTGLIPDHVQEPLELLRNGGLPPRDYVHELKEQKHGFEAALILQRSRLEEAAQLQAKQAEARIRDELTRQFQGEKDALQQRLYELQPLIERTKELENTLKIERERFQAELRTLEGQQQVLRERLAEQERLAHSTPTPPPVLSPPPAQLTDARREPERLRRWWLILAAAPLVALAFWQRTLSEPLQPLQPTSASVAAPALSMPSAVSPGGAPTPLASSPRSPESPPAPDTSALPPRKTECSEGMVLLRPKPAFVMPRPDRPGWPKEEGPPAPVDVPAFCIDAGPVRSLDYGKCIHDKACADPGRGPGGCHRDWKKATTLNCMNRHEAAQFCAWRGAHLPRVVQWEIAKGSAKIRMDGRTGEWAAEDFPAPIFRRGPASADKGMLFAKEKWPGMDPGWNQSSSLGVRREDVAFRCAEDL